MTETDQSLTRNVKEAIVANEKVYLLLHTVTASAAVLIFATIVPNDTLTAIGLILGCAYMAWRGADRGALSGKWILPALGGWAVAVVTYMVVAAVAVNLVGDNASAMDVVGVIVAIVALYLAGLAGYQFGRHGGPSVGSPPLP